MRSKIIVAGTCFLTAALLMATPGASAAPQYDRTCGLLPGDGAFSYVRVANTTCRHGWKVVRKARKKFCKARNDCVMKSDTDFYRGQVRRNGWRCKVAVGWEYFRAKCRRGNVRVVSMAGA